MTRPRSSSTAIGAIASIWPPVRSAVRLDHRDDLVVAEHAVAALRRAEHRRDQLVRRLVAALLEPVYDIRFAGVVTDLDLLLLAEHAGRHAGVDPIGEPGIALLLGLDDRRGVHAGRGPECVGAGE